MSTKRKPVYDTKLAAYLTLKGHRQTSEPSFIGRPTFYFQDSDKLTNDIKDFFERRTTVDALGYATELYRLRALIYQGQHNAEVSNEKE